MKSWYTSKTVWFNGVTIVVAIATFFGFTPDQTLFTSVTALLVAASPFVNIVLRFVTEKAIGTPTPAPVVPTQPTQQ